MPKPTKSANQSAEKRQPLRFYTAQPWKCTHHANHSEITAYVEASGQWEIVATIPETAGASAEVIANFICGLVHNHQQSQSLLQAAVEALEGVMQDGLNFSTEQAADRILSRIKEKTTSR